MTPRLRPWFYLRDGLRVGPVAETALRELLREEAIEADSSVWTEGMLEWESAAAALPRYAGVNYDEATTPPAIQALALPNGPVLFQVAPMKFIIMSVVTGGIYEFFWSYRNWKYFKNERGMKISPFWRAWFVFFFHYSLMKRSKQEMSPHIAVTYSPGWLTVAYLALLILPAELPEAMWFLSFFSFLLLLPAVNAINRVNLGRVPDEDLNRRFTPWNIAMIVIFLAFQLLNIAFMIWPNLWSS